MTGIDKTEMMISHSDNQIEKHNVPRFLQTMKALGPRSYEKAFGGMEDEVVVFAMTKAIDGLTRQQLQAGLDQMFEQGYCPDPIMFRKWCLGIKGFESSVDSIKGSYKGKFAAIANIEAWLSDSTTKITNAEREAYNRVYGMFNQLQWANNYEKAKYYAYEAFKDAYVEVVKELVAKGESQSIWIEPPKLDRPKVVAVKKDYLKKTPEQIAKEKELEDKIKSLVESGLTLQQASLQVMKGG